MLHHKLQVLEAHCQAVGRDYATLRKTLTRTVFLSRSRAIAEQRAGALLDSDVPPFVGEPAALVDHLHELNALGFDLFQMVFADFPETGDIQLFVHRRCRTSRRAERRRPLDSARAGAALIAASGREHGAWTRSSVVWRKGEPIASRGREQRRPVLSKGGLPSPDEAGANW